MPKGLFAILRTEERIALTLIYIQINQLRSISDTDKIEILYDQEGIESPDMTLVPDVKGYTLKSEKKELRKGYALHSFKQAEALENLIYNLCFKKQYDPFKGGCSGTITHIITNASNSSFEFDVSRLVYTSSDKDYYLYDCWLIIDPKFSEIKKELLYYRAHLIAKINKEKLDKETINFLIEDIICSFEKEILTIPFELNWLSGTKIGSEFKRVPNSAACIYNKLQDIKNKLQKKNYKLKDLKEINDFIQETLKGKQTSNQLSVFGKRDDNTIKFYQKISKDFQELYDLLVRCDSIGDKKHEPILLPSKIEKETPGSGVELQELHTPPKSPEVSDVEQLPKLSPPIMTSSIFSSSSINKVAEASGTVGVELQELHTPPKSPEVSDVELQLKDKESKPILLFSSFSSSSIKQIEGVASTEGVELQKLRTGASLPMA